MGAGAKRSGGRLTAPAAAGFGSGASSSRGGAEGPAGQFAAAGAPGRCSGRAADSAFEPVDRRFDEDVVGAADQEQMFDIVAPHNDELALAVEVIDIDNVQPARAIAAAGRTDAASEQQTENIKQRAPQRRGTQRALASAGSS